MGVLPMNQAKQSKTNVIHRAQQYVFLCRQFSGIPFSKEALKSVVIPPSEMATAALQLSEVKRTQESCWDAALRNFEQRQPLYMHPSPLILTYSQHAVSQHNPSVDMPLSPQPGPSLSPLLAVIASASLPSPQVHTPISNSQLRGGRDGPAATLAHMLRQHRQEHQGF
mmetsp:Transcript_1129/g.2951  ORF Transcript_1129/g.2951 Transcript_1129/m.2951 type:complete len:168 (+) Transcript_1129:122-625(+)